MRKGEIGPLMYLVLAILVLLAVILLIMKLTNRSWDLIDIVRGALR